MQYIKIHEISAPVRETWLIGHFRSDSDLSWEIVVAGEEIAQPICNMLPSFGITQFRAELEPFAETFFCKIPLSDNCHASLYGDFAFIDSLDCTLQRGPSGPDTGGFYLKASGMVEDDSGVSGPFSVSADVEFRGIWIYSESADHDRDLLAKLFPNSVFRLASVCKDKRFYNLSGATQHFLVEDNGD
jgi:hypothetical protein